MMTTFLTRYSVYLLAGFIALKLPVLAPAVEYFCISLAKLVAGLTGIFDSGIFREGDVVVRNTYGYAVKVSQECSALEFCVVMMAAVLAYPTTWGQRIQAIGWVVLAVQSLNILRICSLIYCKVFFSQAYFNMIHEQIWPLLLSTFCACYFIAWATYQYTPSAPRLRGDVR